MKWTTAKVPSMRVVKGIRVKIGVTEGNEVTTEKERKAGIEIMTKKIMKRGNDPIRIERGRTRGSLMLMRGTGKKITAEGTNTKCRGRGLGLTLAPGHTADGKRKEQRETLVIKAEIAIKSEKRRDKVIVMDMMQRETEEEIEVMMERTRKEGEIETEMVGEMDVTEAMMQEIKTEVEIIRAMIEITTEVPIETIMATRTVGDEIRVTSLIIILSHRIINTYKVGV
jgi:hypothetical protein